MVVPLARGLMMIVAFAGAASAAEYRDPKDVFTIAYDDSVWSIEDDGDGEFSIACNTHICGGTVAGCSASKMWVPFGTVKRLTGSFDARDTERTLLDTLATQKAIADKDQKDRPLKGDDIAPEIIKPYSLSYVGDGHPVYDADFRVSLAGRVTRFISFSTAARNYSMAFVCHVPEEELAVWRPRFDALMAGFRPIPRTGWRVILDLIGL